VDAPEERAARLAAVGWAEASWEALPSVAWTLARARAPRSGRWAVVVAAWCLPALLVAAAVGRHSRYHRDGATVVVTLRRNVSEKRQAAVWFGSLVVVWLVVLLLKMVLGVDFDRPSMLLALYPVGAYALSVELCRSVRDRRERTPEERRGRLRLADQPRTGWTLGRIATRDGHRAETLPAVASLVDAVVPPGEETFAVAASDALQAELESVGFVEPERQHGVVVRRTPVGEDADRTSL
jgi:hypothetical protein